MPFAWFTADEIYGEDTARPHQGINQRLPSGEGSRSPRHRRRLPHRQILRKPILSGLINEYARAAWALTPTETHVIGPKSNFRAAQDANLAAAPLETEPQVCSLGEEEGYLAITEGERVSQSLRRERLMRDALGCYASERYTLYGVS